MVLHFMYSYGWNNNKGNLKLNLNICDGLWISPVNTFMEEKGKILYAGILNYKPSYSVMESETGTGWIAFLIGFCIIDSFWHFLSKIQLSCSIFIIMLHAKLCTAWIALLCLERIKNYVLGRVKVFDVQDSEREAVLIHLSKYQEHIILACAACKKSQKQSKSQKTSTDHDFLPLKSAFAWETSFLWHYPSGCSHNHQTVIKT